MYAVDNDVLGSKSLALLRGKALVEAGSPRREAAKQIYFEYFDKAKVQRSQYDRRLNYLVCLLAK